MNQRPVLADQRLRHLLRTGRRAAGGLSQRSAARNAGISPVYWQKIESGTLAAAPAGTLAAMCMAVRITAAQLRDEGYAEIAAVVAELRSMTLTPPTPEEHLAATPGASPEEVDALKAVWLALRTRCGTLLRRVGKPRP